jgi:hypothetical protein
MYETAARMERYFTFSSRETMQIAITSLIAAFSLTMFNGWGIFNITQGEGLPSYFFNLTLMFVFIFTAIVFNTSVQKFVAIRLGYVGEYNYWKNGFLISLLLCFLTVGFLPIFFIGGMHFKTEKKLRMGRFRYGLMNKDVGWISFAGPFFSVVLASIFGAFYVAIGAKIIFAFVVANLMVAIYSLIPFPIFEGVKQFKGGTTGLFLFWGSRWVYVTTLAFVMVYSLLVFIAQAFSLIIAAIMAIFIGILYYANFEKL